MRKKVLIKSLIAAAVAGVGHAAVAATIYTSNGFENPPFTPGTVVGQDGWIQSGGGADSAVVTAGSGNGGNQGLNVTRVVNNDARFLPTPVSITPTGANSQVNVDWDMKVPQAGGTQTFGPFFGIEVYDAASARLAGVGMDARTGEILFEDPTSLPTPGAFNTTPADDVVSFNAFHHYQLQMDYSTHKMNLVVDGSTKLSGVAFATNSNTFGDADISALAAAQEVVTQEQNGTAVFDNYVVSSVPEPTTLAAFAVGGLLLLRRRIK